MDELKDTIQEVSDNLSQLSDDTSNSIDEITQSVTDVSEKAGQLDFPLTADSIDRIKEVFPTGSVTLTSGVGIVSDPRVNQNNTIIYSVNTSSGIPVMAVGNPQVTYSYALGNGAITFISSINTDTSTLVYVIF